MKKLLITALLLVGVLGVNAQTFGVKAGMNYNNWRSSEDLDELDPLLAFQAGIFTKFNLSEKFSLQPELLYTAKGVQAADNSDVKLKMNYLDIPILVQYHVNDAFSVNLGPELSFITQATYTNGTIDEDFKDECENFVYGLNVGISYELPMGLIFDARYAYGLSSILKSYTGEPDILNTALQVTVGYVIPFNKK